MSQSAMVIDENDNVATALRQLEAGASIRIEIGSGAIDTTVSQTIPFGHKFALTDIEPGEPIVKYGEVIGLAAKKIMMGEHTHVHNVEGPRGRGEKE